MRWAGLVVVKNQIRNTWVQGWSWPVSRQLYPEAQFCKVIGEEKHRARNLCFVNTSKILEILASILALFAKLHYWETRLVKNYYNNSHQTEISPQQEDRPSCPVHSVLSILYLIFHPVEEKDQEEELRDGDGDIGFIPPEGFHFRLAFFFFFFFLFKLGLNSLKTKLRHYLKSVWKVEELNDDRLKWES